MTEGSFHWATTADPSSKNINKNIYIDNLNYNLKNPKKNERKTHLS